MKKRGMLWVIFLVGGFLSMIIAGCVAPGTAVPPREKSSAPATVAEPVADVPMMMTFDADIPATKRAIVEMFMTSGETMESATDSMIRTGKKRISGELGAVTSMMGRAEIYAQKTITLMPAKGGKGTDVMVQVDTYRRTAFTEETKKNWPKEQNAVRKDFFDKLSEKIKPII